MGLRSVAQTIDEAQSNSSLLLLYRSRIHRIFGPF